MTEHALAFRDLSKEYRVYPRPADRLLEAVTGRSRHVRVAALRGVSGQLARGEVMGLIGENGSGKSTLLKILAGTTPQTSGEFTVSGRVTSILELGASFHPDVTGRQNVVLQAALTGLTRSEIEAALPAIEAFAELGDFFERPVRTYSSGMSMRLAFSVATAVLPDVVILDEALAVGDARFQKKCIDRIFDLKSSGRTIFFCSHALYYISTFCDRALWLRDGSVAGSGEAQKVVLEYERFLAGKDRGMAAEDSVPDGSGTHAKITSVRLLDRDGFERAEFAPGDAWSAEVEVAVDDPARPVQLHLAVSTPDNVVCFTADSRIDGVGPFSGRRRHRIRISLDALPLGKGEFVVFAYVGDETSLALYDARSDLRFRVESPVWRSGLMRVEAAWSMDDPSDARAGS
ncbi:MAG: ABC transporter ATP-binding protein [Thermoanaerobaculia bacterium]|nr:ABC transporter ATP-binding protein [Thermoanaerobaculia bacterium]